MRGPAASALAVAGLLCLLAAAALGMAAVHGFAAGFDHALLRGLRQANDLATPAGPAWGLALARALTLAGWSPALAAATAVTAALLWRSGARRAALQLGAGAALAFLLAGALKLAVARARPEVTPYLGGFSGYSYPSSHAMLSMAVYVMIALTAPALRRARTAAVAGAAALALLVGATRPYLGVHWPTDVLGGWLAGAGVALAYAAARARDHAPPQAGPSGLASG